ncbi:sulfotransferase family protein [Lamprobacter modestohalophilus]|uniref:sulfotransferase family protein n=1 Tax=Lamprobacter modestohalophilus TaxID=1064514 RepID=UPI003D18DC5F
MANKIEQLFILGAPRSGTTFLSALLTDTRFGPPVETHFITKYAPLTVAGYTKPKNAIKTVRRILAERPVQQWRLGVTPQDILASTPAQPTYADIVNAVCLHRQGRQGKLAWGDKTPHYIDSVNILDKHFPDARFIYIVRDGRDVALSLLRKPWGPNNIWSCAIYWARLNRKQPVLDALIESGRCLCISYESLLEESEHHVNLIYEFLGENVTVERVRELCSKTMSDNHGKWRKLMSADQIRLFEKIGGETLARFGYDLESTGLMSIPLHRSATYWAHDRILWLIYMFKLNVIDAFGIRFLGWQPFGD